MNLKKRMWEILDAAKDGDKVSKTTDVFILCLIFLNVAAVILETVVLQGPEDTPQEALWRKWFFYFELISVTVFSLEYLLRFWACTSDERFKRPILGRIRYALTPSALIDLAAIAPSILLLNVDTRSVRALRLLRIFRLAKTGRYYRSVRTLGRVFLSRKEELAITFSLLVFLLVVTSTLMYFVEHDAQPEEFSSIPATMWWAVATLTTVGYGDVAPITDLGRLFGAVVAIIGIGLFALPTSILGSGFMEEFQENKTEKHCPHCGGDL